MSFNVGILGGGNISQTHARAALEIDGVTIAAVCGQNFEKLKRLIDEGTLGKPILISASVRWYRPPEYYKSSRWRGTRALDGGGALMNQGIHTVDLLLWLFGDVSQVCARAITGLHDIEVEDTVV